MLDRKLDQTSHRNYDIRKMLRNCHGRFKVRSHGAAVAAAKKWVA